MQYLVDLGSRSIAGVTDMAMSLGQARAAVARVIGLEGLVEDGGDDDVIRYWQREDDESDEDAIARIYAGGDASPVATITPSQEQRA